MSKYTSHHCFANFLFHILITTIILFFLIKQKDGIFAFQYIYIFQVLRKMFWCKKENNPILWKRYCHRQNEKNLRSSIL